MHDVYTKAMQAVIAICVNNFVFADHSGGRLCPFMYIPGDNSDHALVS